MSILDRILNLLENCQNTQQLFLMCRICKVCYKISDLLCRSIDYFNLIPKNRALLILLYHLRQLFSRLHPFQIQEFNEAHFFTTWKIYSLNLLIQAGNRFNWFYQIADFSFQVDLHSLFEIGSEEIAVLVNLGNLSFYISVD